MEQDLLLLEIDTWYLHGERAENPPFCRGNLLADAYRSAMARLAADVRQVEQYLQSLCRLG